MKMFIHLRMHESSDAKGLIPGHVLALIVQRVLKYVC